ncbi:MAG TPA: C25 family cysteine peptidase, partial [Halanaerobiales bacterium]|nr:C25 family cysteine peptidase [Halanaerobiales bacterium]
PIDVVDVNQDGVFNSGDYFQFVGGPPRPADEYTRMNIYNNTNVYWFSYQADTTNYYKYIDGFPVSFATPAITNSVHTLTWERDLVYQQFGHARNNKRDYWMWGYAEARNRTPFKDFIFETYDSIAFHRVPTKPDVKIRVGMHGLTDISCQSGNGHSATIRFNGKPLGVKNWNGQESAVFEKDFFIAAYTFGGGDTAQIFADKQRIEVNLFGNICPGATSDFIWINYIEFDYWRWNRTYPNYFYFTSPPDNFQENRYYLFNWGRDNMKIYIPERGELIPNPDIRNDADKSVYFVDTITKRTDYYCVANDYYLTPDSIVHHLNNSDLRNPANGADYIIITHKKFKSAAERLADFRSNNLPGYSNPRIKIVDIDDIYVEFSNGLLNPFALKEFSKYAFENWTSPAPYFIVLIGDMSSDYRSIHAFSDENYIPSIPFHGEEFGLLPSDNLIVSITPGDNYPDLSIGRLACQTIEEANNLVDKIMNYPEDNSKEWKENTILLASGLSHEDQLQFRFNYFSKLLEAGQLLPNGIRTTKVFNYPENAEDSVFIGSGPRMREEINKGAAVVSYYGHGGGAQWDLIFTKDDIPELTNSGRLPFISSITCYTAHFDNAESFGEIFVKIPNKGAIGF